MKRIACFAALLSITSCGKKRASCEDGFYSASGTCTEVGVGYYSDNSERRACSNAPTNAHYTSTIAASSDCPWDCDDNYLVNADATGCDARANTAALTCGANEVAVGIYGRTGSWMDKLGVRCASFSNGTVGTTVTDSTASGGSGGNAFSYDCPAGSVLVQVSGKNGTPCSTTSTSFHQYNCINPTTKALSGLTSKYGEGDPSGCPGTTAFDYSCADGRYAYGITVDSDGTGTYVGFTLGLNCR